MSVPDISGRAIANLGVSELRHVAPMFHGDTLYGATEVLEVRPSQSRPGQGVLTVRTDGHKQDGSKVCIFTRSVLLPRPAGGDGLMAEAGKGPLAGVRVVELATVLAGPGTGKYLADFGADVIKVEPPGGDPTRRMGWTGKGETDAYFWKLINRNKQADRPRPEAGGRQGDALGAARRRRSADREHAAGQARRARLHAAEMLRRNPKLVILRISGFGQTGPYAQQPGFATIAEALSGFSELLGEAGGPPLLPPIAVTDEVTAIVGAFAAMVALRHAEKTGEGQEVDVNLLESMFQIMGPLASRPTPIWAISSRASARAFPTPCRAAPTGAPTAGGSPCRPRPTASPRGSST